MSDISNLEKLARAYDREDASQRGEPDPWQDGGDDAEWVSERLACAKAALDAIAPTHAPAHVDIEALVERLNQPFVYENGEINDDLACADMREAATALLAIKAERDEALRVEVAADGTYTHWRDRALHAESAMGVTAVKELEWTNREFAPQVVVAQIGLTYTLQNGRDGWFAAVTGTGISEYVPGDFETREACQAAAQADFTTRIRSCLAPGNAEPVATGEDAYVISVLEREVGEFGCNGPDEEETTISNLIAAERAAYRRAHPAPAKGVSEASREDIARVLFEQRQTPFDWDDSLDDPESDAGTLRSICLDDADAVLAALALSGTGKAVEGPADGAKP